MKFNKNLFAFFGKIRKYKTLAAAERPAHSLRIVPVMEAFFSSVNSREKLQIIYANIRV
jgi:hypothetical protein